MADKRDFNARLSRIGATALGPSTGVRPRSLRRIQARQGPGKRCPNPYYLIAAAVGFVGAVLVGLHFMSTVSRESAEKLTSRFLNDLPAPVLAQSSSIGVLQGAEPYTASMLRYLPQSPWGWVRVNTWDARYPQVKTRLQTVFSEKNELLSGNAGYMPLMEFLTVFSDPENSSELRRGARVLSSAIFLNPGERTYLEVELRHRTLPECCRTAQAAGSGT